MQLDLYRKNEPFTGLDVIIHSPFEVKEEETKKNYTTEKTEAPRITSQICIEWVV